MGQVYFNPECKCDEAEGRTRCPLILDLDGESATILGSKSTGFEMAVGASRAISCNGKDRRQSIGGGE